MQFRLLGEELALLYSSAETTNVPDNCVRRFFGVIELTESASQITDVLAMRSLRASIDASGAMRFDLGQGLVLLARRRRDGADDVIEFLSLART